VIIYITSGCETSAVARRVSHAFPRAETHIVEDSENARRALYDRESGSEKHNIFITRSRGRHFKVCPGTESPYICCLYWTLQQSSNCPFDCTYCILQYYLNDPLLTVYADMEALKSMVRERIRREPARIFRVGTGELADSLALDPVTRAGPELIRFAAQERNMLLELKTKSAQVDHLMGIAHRGKTVISWSLNPSPLIREHEHHTAALSERLKAMKKVQEAGYMLGVHFDPVLWTPDWREHYDGVARELFKYADPARIAWISMGSLRFPPEMRDRIERKFPGTDLLNAEMVRGADNKSRYVKPLRIRMYRHLYKALKKYGGEDLFIYFCMEDAAVWRSVTGSAPDSDQHLDYCFAEYLTGKFPELQLPAPRLREYRDFHTRRSWEKD